MHRRMRIAMIATPYYEVPPTGYGGIELICATLADGLVARGHDVTLFAAGRRNGTRARFVSTNGELQHHRLGEAMPTLLHAARVDQLLSRGRFDVVHDHSTAGPLMAAKRDAPTVVTVHNSADGELGSLYADLADAIHLVAISEAQRERRPELNWLGTVHNAIDPAEFSYRPAPDGPVLWLARFCPDKGPDLAIQACRAAGLPLTLVGKCSEPGERQYLEETIRPMVSDDVRLLVNADRSTIRGLLTEARCLVMPIRWHEPFGMVMIEALASGTPVVALRRGSVPEVVRDGVTGFICDDPSELPAAMLRTAELDPADCLADVRRRFSAELMVRRYEQMYTAAIARHSARQDGGLPALRGLPGVTPEALGL
jgi:glycosyltransferase involved in cell wall biosynthesis